MDDLLQEFIAETRETLEALSGEIVAWEANPTDGTRLAAIFRFVHTVKGSCGFLDLPRLARLSHAAEDALGAVRSGDRQPDRAFVNAVLAVVDRIGALVEAIDAGTSIDGNGEDVLIAALAEGSAEVAQTVTVAQRAPSRSVRLNVELLDRMMSGMSDMVLARNELARRLRDENPDPALEAALERMSATVADMRDTVTRTRMQKIDALFSALPRLVRDTAAGLGKSVTLCMEGADVELDREMIEMLRDPLVHIIRNSIDHGIETPTARRAAGKRENGRLTVSARQSGNQIIVEITDDGAGIDTGRLIGKMVAAGRSEAELRAMSEQALLDLIFTPGVSTKDEVSDISGRGVGMDVVRTAIEAIGGRIELHSTRWRGLRLAIHVPLTLSIIPTIIVGVGAQQFAVPRQAIEEIVGEHGDAVHIDRVGTSRLATLRERRLPLVELAERFAIPGTDDGAERMLVIVGAGVGSYAMMVDSVIDSEELVIKPAAPAIMASGLFAGQTLPDSGRPMLMLDCAGIAADAGLHFEREVAEDVDAAAADHAETRVLLFRDLDDVTRAVPLVAVDRVESVARTAIARSGGALRLTLDGQIIPLIASGDLADREQVAIMRLEDGASGIAYAIVEPLDIVSISDALVPPREPGAFAGVALVDGEQVEVLDLHWLFARHADRRAVAGDGPLCRIDDDPWLGNFVRPLLEQAGYRVTTRSDAGVAPDVVIGFGKDGVRLHRDGDGADATDGSVWRYDREAILAAVSARAGRGGGR